MANNYNSQPIVLDTDMTTGWKSLQTLDTTPRGLWVFKITILTNGTTGSGGTISVLDPNDNTVLYPGVYINATASAIGLVSYFDDITTSSLTWRDFKVTGLTSTQSKMFIWYR